MLNLSAQTTEKLKSLFSGQWKTSENGVLKLKTSLVADQVVSQLYLELVFEYVSIFY